MNVDSGYKCLYAALAAALMIGGQATALASGKVQADIPFAFQAAGKTMRAGRYLFIPAQAQGVVQVLGENGDGALVTMELPATKESERPSLVFEKGQGLPRLTKIRTQQRTGLAGVR